MCYFITGCVSKGVDLSRLNEMVGGLGLDRSFFFTELKNPFATSQLPNNSSYCSMSRGHCDCGTAIGNATKGGRTTPPSKAKLKRLRAKGWSDARIERWKNERESALNTKHRPVTPSHDDELKQWWLLMTTALKSGQTQHFGIMKHWYSTDVFNEKFEFSTFRVSTKTLQAAYLSDLDEDTLYLFEP